MEYTKKILIIVLVIAVVSAVAIALFFFSSSVRDNRVQKQGESFAEGLRIRVLEVRRIDALKACFAATQVNNQTYAAYALYYRDNGYVYLIKLRVSNEASTTRGVVYKLLADRDIYDLTLSCNMTPVTPPLPVDPRYRELFERAIELDASELYGTNNTSVMIPPGTTVEYHVFFCTPRDDTPRKLRVRATTPEGRLFEFDVDLR